MCEDDNQQRIRNFNSQSGNDPAVDTESTLHFSEADDGGSCRFRGHAGGSNNWWLIFFSTNMASSLVPNARHVGGT